MQENPGMPVRFNTRIRFGKLMVMRTALDQSFLDAGCQLLLPGKSGIFRDGIFYYWTSLMTQMVKNLPAMWETQVQSLGQENPLEEEMVQYSCHGQRSWWATVHGVAKSWTGLSE